MSESHQLFCIADPVFYDDLARWRSGGAHLSRTAANDLAVATRELPPGWRRAEHGVWTNVRPVDAVLPDEGWKIHVSATLAGADRVCTAVWEHCVTRGVAFKHLRDRSMVLALNSKYAPRGSSGKLLTLYPRDEAELRTLLEELTVVLDGEQGPAILTDLHWGPAPLYVRYGAFRAMRCLDDEGRSVPARHDASGALVPDSRRPVFRPPADVPLPGFLAERLAARTAASGEEPPYRVEKTLHFSNAGGVYVGTRVADGRRVVLKEARAHAAVDDNHEDAVTRLDREARTLQRLAGIDGVPEYVDRFAVGDHHFLVEEFVDGQPLHVWRGCTDPWTIDSSPTPEALAAFTAEVLDLVAQLRELVAAMHARGVVFGDLHLGNVMVRPDGRVALVDYELAFDVTDRDRVPGLRATGFGTTHKTGVDVDLHGLAAVELGLFLMLNRVVALEPRKLDQFVGIVESSFPLPDGWGARIRRELAPEHPAPTPCGDAPLAVDLDDPAVDTKRVAASIAAGVLLAATPERTDRLFPGDVAQFGGGEIGLAHGAAGVLWALHAAGQGRHPDHERWLRAAVGRRERTRTGLYDGSAGVAWVLDRFGHHDEAARLLHEDLAELEPRTGMTLHAGLAGTGLVHLQAAARTGERWHRDRAAEVADRLADAVRSGDPHCVRGPGTGAPRRPVPAGLLRGWSGVALFLLRRYEATGDRAHLELAVRAVHRDLDRCVVTRDGSLQVEEPGVRTLGYLEIGSAGIALVIDELLDHVDDARLRHQLPALVQACRRTFVFGIGLWTGRAGLLATLARLGGRHGLPDVGPDIAGHVARLSWHAVSLHGEVAFPGTLDLRLSTDLATGSSGVLLALAVARGDTGEFLPFLTPRSTPRGPAAGAARTTDITEGGVRHGSVHRS